jgi:rhodanese-related sulfurtransferase
MSSASFFVSPQQLWSRIGTADAPMILDVCRRAVYDAGAGVIPTSHWQQPETYADWLPGLPADRPIVLACRYGHNLSQMVAAELRGRGVPAQVLEAAARPGPRLAFRWCRRGRSIASCRNAQACG